MIAMVLGIGLAAVPDEEELPEEVQLDRSVPDSEPTPANRGRVALLAGASRWQHPAASLSGELQLHLGRWMALHLEGGAHRLLALDHGERTFISLPEAALGVALDPVAEARLKPQLAVDLLTQVIHLDWRERRLFVSGGLRARFGLDLQVAGPLHLGLEGYLGGLYVLPSMAERLNPRWAGISPQYGSRAGLVMRW